MVLSGWNLRVFPTRETSECFLEICRDNKRDKVTLLEIIQRRVKKGTHILTDGWAAYTDLPTLGNTLTHTLPPSPTLTHSHPQSPTLNRTHQHSTTLTHNHLNTRVHLGVRQSLGELQGPYHRSSYQYHRGQVSGLGLKYLFFF